MHDCTHIQKRSRLKSDFLDLCINGDLLQNVSCHKILGVYIDNNLTWRDRVDNLCSEMSKLIGLLWRSKHLLPFSSRILFYNSYILPKLNYCLSVWGKTSHSNLDKIWKLQKRAISRIFNKPYDEPTQDLFKQYVVIIYMRYIFISVALRSYSNHLMLQVPFPQRNL